MGEYDPEPLIDRIYEAALIPERWYRVLDDLAQVAGAVGTLLNTADLRAPRVIHSPSLQEFMDKFQAEHWAPHNTRMPKLLGARHAGFIIEEDVYTPDELERDLMVRKFLRPMGLGWATATAFRLPTEDTLIFSIERRFDRGPVPREAVAALDVLRPHLGRAALMSARLQLERAQTTVAALGLLGLPAAVLSGSFRVIASNSDLEALVPRVVLDRRERIALADAQADALLLTALHQPSRNAPLSVPVAADGDKPAMVVHLVPIKGDARDIFVNASFVLVVTPVVPSKVADAEVIQALVPRVVLDRRERIALADTQADALLLTALHQPSRNAPLSVPVAADGDRPAMVVHLVPVKGDARDMFVNASFVLVVTPVAPSKVADAEVIQALFDLTAAEARVARGIAEGATVEDIAVRHGVSPGTVRNQIKAIFAKTGVSRQVDLARLLSGLSLRA